MQDSRHAKRIVRPCDFATCYLLHLSVPIITQFYLRSISNLGQNNVVGLSPGEMHGPEGWGLRASDEVTI